MARQPGDIEHLSYSSVSTFLMCGRCWQLRYLEQLEAPIAPALAFGGAFHETVEAYVRRRARGDSPPPLTALWDEKWQQRLEAEGENISWGADSAEDLRGLGIRMFGSPEVISLIDELRPWRDDTGEFLIEQRVSMDVPGVPIPIIGYVDMVDAEGVPVDFKTAARAWNDDQASREIQPTMYIAALEQVGHTANPQRKFRHYVFTKTKTPKAQVIETVRGEADITFMCDLVGTVWKGISAGVFVPNPMNWKCSPKYCEYWETCRERAAGG